jgi:hypothetical protein
VAHVRQHNYAASVLTFQEYYDELIQSKKHDGIRVNYNGEHGKGTAAE